MPYMLFLPMGAVKWLLEEPRTAEDFYDWLTAEAQRTDPFWTADEIELAIAWTITAAQKKGSLALELKLTTADEEEFDVWMHRRLDSTLGARQRHADRTGGGRPTCNGIGSRSWGGDDSTATGWTDAAEPADRNTDEETVKREGTGI